MQEIINQVVPIIVTGLIIPIIVEGIRLLRRKTSHVAFLEKLSIDDTLFEVAEDVIRTFGPEFIAAATQLDANKRRQALATVVNRMKQHGVDVWKTHGRDGIEEVLNEAFASVRSELGLDFPNGGYEK